MQKEKWDVLKIRWRGDDTYRSITVRLPLSLVEKLEEIAGKTNYSRNKIITMLIEYGVDRIEILPP